MRTWILSLILLLTASLSWAKPRNPLPQTPDQIWQNDLDLLQDINVGLEEVTVTSTTLPTGSTNYIQNTSDLQSGAVFHVSSGTVQGSLYVINSSTGIDIVSGGFSLIGGADSSATTRTNNTLKIFRIGGYHYQNGEETIGMINSLSDNPGTARNLVRIGGGTSIQNAATQLEFYTGSNATTLAGTLRLQIAADGEITQPTQPSFLVTQANNLTDITGDGTTQTISFPTEVYDQGGDIANSTFTAPVTGRYSLCAGIRLGGILTTHTDRTIRIVTSNRSYVSNESYSLAQTTYWVGFCTIADMDANDTALLNVAIDGSTKVVDVVGAATTNFFSGSLIN